MEKCIIKINGEFIKCKKETRSVLGAKKPFLKTIYLLKGYELYKNLPRIIEIEDKKYYKSERLELDGSFNLIEV